MDVRWVGLLLSLAPTVFWAGFYFGSLRGKLARLSELIDENKDMKIQIRDLERAMKVPLSVGAVPPASRSFVSRFPEEPKVMVTRLDD